MTNIHTSILPKRDTVNNETYKFYFTEKIGNKSKYVTMHDEDKQYILFWLDRFVMDMCAKQVINPMFLENIMDSNDNMPKSQYSNKRNSILSYTAGIVSNFRRNPTEDFGKNQLHYISYIMRVINHVYTDILSKKDLGYNNITKQANELPKKVMFKKV